MELDKRTIGIYVAVSLVLAGLVLTFNEIRKSRRAVPAKAATELGSGYPGCVPAPQPEGALRLAVGGVSTEGDQTRIRVVAYTVGESADFFVPQYLMSRGRWLINESARSYIRDEKCQEYRLQDRTPTAGQVPDSGLIKLKAGEAYEMTLVFAKLPDNIRRGSLVYAKWVIPFSVAR